MRNSLKRKFSKAWTGKQESISKKDFSEIETWDHFYGMKYMNDVSIKSEKNSKIVPNQIDICNSDR